MRRLVARQCQDDDRLVFLADLADTLRSCSLARPPEGVTSRPKVRTTYKGMSHGGLDALTSITWQRDRQV